MSEVKDIIIIPDVHGRTFWHKAVEGHENDPIVFLGDYLDPYLHYEPDVSQEGAIDEFQQILAFKKAHKDNVILLLGNHDCGYMFDKGICSCRRDVKNAELISELFRSNYDLFQLAYEVTSESGKVYRFSHAGIMNIWLQTHEDIHKPLDENMVHFVNRMYAEKDAAFIYALGDISRHRGGWMPYGSMIWADLFEWVNPYKHFGTNLNLHPDVTAYQIVGHTQLQKPVITDFLAALDVRRGFILHLDTDTITELDGSEIDKAIL